MSFAETHRVAWMLAATLAGWTLGACADDPMAQLETSSASLVGLYVPDSPLGAAASGTGGAGSQTTSDAEIMGYFAVPPGDRCVGIMSDGMAKPGVMTVQFKTVSLRQMWTPANVGAVWIEDANEHYVKTLELWAGVRKKSLYKWGKRACQSAEPDVISGATFPMPGEHKATWNGKDLKGAIVPDGLYKLFIEVTETESDVGRTAVYDIPKGPMPVMLQPPDTEPHQGLKVTYTPMP